MSKSREKTTWIFSGTVDLSAANGGVGTLLLDPENINIVQNINIVSGDNDDQLGDNEILKGDKAVNENPLGTFNISATALENLSATANVLLEATNDVTIVSQPLSLLSLLLFLLL